MRLFVALQLSDAVKRLLLECMGQLQKQALSASLIRPDNLHITLAFIGETDRLASIREVLKQTLPPGPLYLSIGNVGRFGDLWWVGVENNQALADYAYQIQRRLRSSGFPLEQRRFIPHIAIARRVTVVEPIDLEFPNVTMRVDSISLMKSERIENRPVYTELCRYAFPKGDGRQ